MRKTKEELEKMLLPKINEEDKTPLLYRFSYWEKEEKKDQYFFELENLAENEIWDSSPDKKNDILINYIVYTFQKVFIDCSLDFSDDDKYCCFNTGLLTENGEDIICLFNEFSGSKKWKWHIRGFKKESDWDIMDNFSTTPAVSNYFEDPSSIYFDPKKEIVSNFDHILDENFNRFDKELQAKGKVYIQALLQSALKITQKKCLRNYRIAVPQYYNNEITYLLPVNLDGHKMALAVKTVRDRYRANTIFTLEMAYKNARLLMKPEADWLAPSSK